MQSFGHFLAEARVSNHCYMILSQPSYVCVFQTAPLFSWDSSKEKFVGPAQKASMDRDRMKVTEEVEKKQVCIN